MGKTWNVLIVEDEYFFRQALKKYVQQIGDGADSDRFAVSGEARNGCDGLDKLAELTPDITLVDITMPVMDGITFIRRAREKQVRTQFVILTGYSEFEYARQAIQLGVQAYLLKPLDSGELEKSLRKAAGSIEREREMEDGLQLLSGGRERVRALVRENCVKQLLLGEQPEETEQLFIQEGAAYCAGVIDISAYSEVCWKKGDRALWHYAVCNMLRDLARDPLKFETCASEDGLMCILTRAPDAETLDGLLSPALTALCAQAGELLNLSVSICLGTVRASSGEIAESYSEALAIQRYQLFSGRQGVCFYAGGPRRGIDKSCFSSEQRKRMTALLREGDMRKVQGFLHDVFAQMAKASLDSDAVYVHVMDMISAILDVASELGLELSGPDENTRLFSQLFSFQSQSQLHWFVRDCAARILMQRSEKGEDAQKELVNRVAAYIESHYQNPDLRLDVIAGEFYINVQHLCTIFKKHRGVTIGSYLLDVRMRRAQQALRDGAQSISAVARSAGYEDVGYFSKCFKRYYGVSPTQYHPS